MLLVKNEVAIAVRTVCSLKIFIAEWKEIQNVNTFHFVCCPSSFWCSSQTFEIAVIHRLILRHFFWVLFINVRFYRKIIFACFSTYFSFIPLSLMSGMNKSSLMWLDSFVRLNVGTTVRLKQTFCFSVIIFFCQNEASPRVWGYKKKESGK